MPVLKGFRTLLDAYIQGRLVEMTKGAFERKMRENRKKSGLGLFLENPREVEKTFV